METPWGALPIADAHMHFFSHRFFSELAEQKKRLDGRARSRCSAGNSPATIPRLSPQAWIEELDRAGVERAALIASIPGRS